MFSDRIRHLIQCGLIRSLGGFVALLPLCVSAAVINVEYSFTPFVGDIAASQVELVPGKATVYINNVPVAEQEITQRTVPVMFEAREVSPAVWITASSFGTFLRKGHNTIRIDFVPTNKLAKYQTSLRWASVTDQVKEEETANGFRSTNQAGEGSEVKPQAGAVSLEKAFAADFAQGAAWHAYPPVNAVTDEDKSTFNKLLQQRAKIFAPAFDGVYTLLAKIPNVRVDEVRKMKCLEAAYAAGVRVKALAVNDITYSVTGTPVVVLGAKGGSLFTFEPKTFQRIKGGEQQFCAGMLMSMTFPQRMLMIKSPDGQWKELE